MPANDDEDTSMPWTRAGHDALAALDELISPESSISLTGIPLEPVTNEETPNIMPATAAGPPAYQEEADSQEAVEGPSVSFIRSPGLSSIPYRPSQSSLGSFYTAADVQTLTRQNSRALQELNQRTKSIDLQVLTNAVNSPYERAASIPPNRFNPFASSPSPEKQNRPIASTSHIPEQRHDVQEGTQPRSPVPDYVNPRDVFPNYQASEHSRSPSVEYVQEQQSRSPSVEYVDNAFVKIEELDEEDDLPSPGSSPGMRFLSMSPIRLPPSNRYPAQANFADNNPDFDFDNHAFSPPHRGCAYTNTKPAIDPFARSPPRRAFARRSPSIQNETDSEPGSSFVALPIQQDTSINEGSLSPLNSLLQNQSLENKTKKAKSRKRINSKQGKTSRNSSNASLPKRVHPGYQRSSKKSDILGITANRSRDLSDLASELSIVKEEQDENDSDPDGGSDGEQAGKAGKKRRSARSKDTKPRKRSAKPRREDSVFDDEYREAQQERIKYFQEVDKFQLETEAVTVKPQSSKKRFLASFMILM